jgi:hypothetical protein
MSAASPEKLRRLQGQLGAEVSWANTVDRAARTKPAREGFLEKLADQVDPDRKLSPKERALRVEHARKAHMLRMAFASAKARRKKT